MTTPPLVSAEWLHSNLSKNGIIPIDASFNNKAPLRPTIPGGRRIDLDETFSDFSSHLPHTLPKPDDFAKLAGALGISNSAHLVVFDNRGIFSSARVRWMFKIMGHEKVSVLDGG